LKDSCLLGFNSLYSNLFDKRKKMRNLFFFLFCLGINDAFSMDQPEEWDDDSGAKHSPCQPHSLHNHTDNQWIWKVYNKQPLERDLIKWFLEEAKYEVLKENDKKEKEALSPVVGRVKKSPWSLKRTYIDKSYKLEGQVMFSPSLLGKQRQIDEGQVTSIRPVSPPELIDISVRNTIDPEIPVLPNARVVLHKYEVVFLGKAQDEASIQFLISEKKAPNKRNAVLPEENKKREQGKIDNHPRIERTTSHVSPVSSPSVNRKFILEEKLNPPASLAVKKAVRGESLLSTSPKAASSPILGRNIEKLKEKFEKTHVDK